MTILIDVNNDDQNVVIAVNIEWLIINHFFYYHSTNDHLEESIEKKQVNFVLIHIYECMWLPNSCRHKVKNLTFFSF